MSEFETRSDFIAVITSFLSFFSRLVIVVANSLFEVTDKFNYVLVSSKISASVAQQLIKNCQFLYSNLVRLISNSKIMVKRLYLLKCYWFFSEVIILGLSLKYYPSISKFETKIIFWQDGFNICWAHGYILLHFVLFSSINTSDIFGLLRKTKWADA